MLDERFVGFGADKVEHWHKFMCKEHAELVVSHEFYIVHITLGHSHARWSGVSRSNAELDGEKKNMDRWRLENRRLWRATQKHTKCEKNAFQEWPSEDKVYPPGVTPAHNPG
jgi:hypothetical protein